MAKTNIKQKNDNNWKWLIMALLANLLFLPGGIFIKLITDEITPSLLPVLRSGLIVLVLLPFIISGIIKYKKILKKNLKTILLVCVACAVGPLCYAYAMSMSNVSFLAIIDMFTPIAFAIMSVFIVKDKISRNSLIGILFAIFGGIMIFVVPLLTGEGSVVVFGWIPVVLALASMATSALWPVFLRKQNENGLPLPMMIGIGFFFSALAAGIFTITNSGIETFAEVGNISITSWVMIIYLAVVFSICARLLSVKAYKRVGTATMTTVQYLYYLSLIALPIFVLQERLSWEMFVGAGLILAGIIFTRINGHRLKSKGQKK